MISFLLRKLIPIFFLCIVINGCSKESVIYENSSTSLKPEGYMIEGTVQPENLDDGFVAGEYGSLDQTGINLLAEDTTTAEYKSTYGRSTAPLHPVYFDFDSSAVNVDQLDNLNKSSEHLLGDKSLGIIIEGNCDQRGTADYNFALGELRALNVKKYLVNMGVAENRMSTISYGEQRPLYPGTDETSMAKNRRADLVVQ